MLYELGYTKPMLNKIKSIFYKNGLQKFCDYLSLYKIQKIKIRQHNNKHYIAIQT